MKVIGESQLLFFNLAGFGLIAPQVMDFDAYYTAPPVVGLRLADTTLMLPPVVGFQAIGEGA